MDRATAILNVVRGEFRWTELPVGMAEAQGTQEWFFPPSEVPPVMPEPRDVARGIGSYAANKKELREWAGFILAAAPLLSLDRLDGTAEGESLLEALWDIAGGSDLDEFDLAKFAAIAED